MQKNHVMPCKKRAKRYSRPYIHVHPAVIVFFSTQNRAKQAPGGCAAHQKKTGPVKKRMASWARQRQQITEAADGGARARTGADGAVVLNLRRGPGAYALLSRADGQLTRAGQHYYSHLGLRPPSKDFDYNQPSARIRQPSARKQRQQRQQQPSARIRQPSARKQRQQQQQQQHWLGPAMGDHGVEADLSFFSKKRMFFVWLRTRCGGHGGLTQAAVGVGTQSQVGAARSGARGLTQAAVGGGDSIFCLLVDRLGRRGVGPVA